ncbi:MAG: hypothetical protein EKK54_09715 [Neisseriaceae bacterium]|nr:MAG: hypothetical protein EKK54_09715 [Neisseriaceae bacterium]
MVAGQGVLAESNPGFIIFSTAQNNSEYAYVGTDTSIFQCSVKTDGSGDFNSCTQLYTPLELPSFYNAGGSAGISFTNINGSQFMSFSGYHDLYVYTCQVNNDGTISNTCSYTQYSSYFEVTGVTSATINGNSYVYVADYGNTNDTYICPLNASGQFAGSNICTDMTSRSISNSLRYSWSINIHKYNGTNYAYVAGHPVNKNVLQCPVDNNGIISNSCTPAVSPQNLPYFK